MTHFSFLYRSKLFHNFHKEKLNMKKSIHPDLLDKELSNMDHMKDVHDLLDQYNKNLKHSEKKIDVKVPRIFFLMLNTFVMRPEVSVITFTGPH